MNHTVELLKKRTPHIVALILVIHFVLSLVVSAQESMTFDEKAHIPASYSYVRYGDMRLNPEHPPLLKDLAGLSLLPQHPKFPLDSPEWQNGVNEQWLVGDMFVNCSRPEIACNDTDSLLFFSRTPTTIISVLLGIALFLFTQELGGTLAGLVAVTLYAFDPNIIAHDHYVTTDLGSAAFIFIAFYFFYHFLKNPICRNVLWCRNVVWAGIALGLAELAKFSAVLLYPLFFFFTVVHALTTPQPETDTRSTLRFRLYQLWRYLLGYTGIIIICFALIFVVYMANTANMPGDKLSTLADQFLAQRNAFAQFAHGTVQFLSRHFITKSLGEYFLGVFMVFSRVAGGNTHYFFGTVTDASSPWYFPAVFFMKETIPFLLLLLITTFYGLYRITRFVFAHAREDGWRIVSGLFQHSTYQYIGIFFILFYSYISITGNLNIGLRHLFPILPFLYMFVAKTSVQIYERAATSQARQQLFGIGLAVTLFFVVIIPVVNYPSYLSYFNAIAGGHAKGYLYVTDSNYDWGQDLVHLQDFVKDHNNCLFGIIPFSGNCPLSQYPTIGNIRVDYFGGGNPAYYLKEKYIPWWAGRDPEPGWYAISSFFYQENLHKQKAPGEKDYTWLKDKTPLARAGDSFFIYYFTKEDLGQ